MLGAPIIYAIMITEHWNRQWCISWKFIGKMYCSCWALCTGSTCIQILMYIKKNGKFEQNDPKNCKLRSWIDIWQDNWVKSLSDIPFVKDLYLCSFCHPHGEKDINTFYFPTWISLGGSPTADSDLPKIRICWIQGKLEKCMCSLYNQTIEVLFQSYQSHVRSLIFLPISPWKFWDRTNLVLIHLHIELRFPFMIISVSQFNEERIHMGKCLYVSLSWEKALRIYDLWGFMIVANNVCNFLV
jgi:hypothetical protein